MNKRVFFGVNHSVHIESTRIVMFDFNSEGMNQGQKNSVPDAIAQTTNAQFNFAKPIPTMKRLMAAEGEYIMPLSADNLMPLMLCNQLVSDELQYTLTLKYFV